MLRGPQTPGELRTRGERLYSFEDLEGVESTLNHLAELGMVKKLPRQAGSRESRYAHLLAGDIEVSEEAPSAAPRAHSPNGSNAEERIAALERDMAELKREFDEFRRRFE
jgi:uncharacterized protein YceH (UPF0502 family)